MPSTTDGLSPVPFLDLQQQYEGIREEIDAAVARVIRDSSYIGGAPVRAFEEAFAAYVEADHCVAVANGTDAIEIVFEALSFPSGASVIVPANSFIASSEAVTRSGLRVVFADVDPSTYTLDPEDVRRRMDASTAAILAVHLYGQPADLRGLEDVAREHGAVVIEDAAQAHGAKLGGRRVGAQCVAGTFSFYPGKNLGAYGDAGAITTNDAELAERMRMVANHGRIAKYEHLFEGRNSRMDGLQGAILSVKLRHLEAWTEMRRALAHQYREGLAGVGDLVLPEEKADASHVYHLFVVRTQRRDDLRQWLAERDIASGIHYPVALPRLLAYEGHPQHGEPFFAVEAATQLLSLPMGDSISPAQAHRVIAAVRAFFGDS